MSEAYPSTACSQIDLVYYDMIFFFFPVSLLKLDLPWGLNVYSRQQLTAYEASAHKGLKLEIIRTHVCAQMGFWPIAQKLVVLMTGGQTPGQIFIWKNNLKIIKCLSYKIF